MDGSPFYSLVALLFSILFNFCCRLSLSGHALFRNAMRSFLCFLVRQVSIAVDVINEQELEYRLILGESCGTIRLFGVAHRLTCGIASHIFVGRSTEVVRDFNLTERFLK